MASSRETATDCRPELSRYSNGPDLFHPGRQFFQRLGVFCDTSVNWNTPCCDRGVRADQYFLLLRAPQVRVRMSTGLPHGPPPSLVRLGVRRAWPRTVIRGGTVFGDAPYLEAAPSLVKTGPSRTWVSGGSSRPLRSGCR